MAQYQVLPYGPTCLTQADTPWRVFFFSASIVVFFIIPCFILMVLYTLISKNLMTPAPGLVQTSSASLRYRRKVILMLGTVVISFFVLLLPFRVFTLIILFMPEDVFLHWYETNFNLFLIITYSCRILIHINSAINPILYNLMSSKFRNGFYKLFLINRLWCEFFLCPNSVGRKNTLTNSLVTTTTTNLTSSSVIKHQYSISSVHSNKSKQSVTRKQTKRHKCDRKLPQSHQCQYCNKQVHVNIEDIRDDVEVDGNQREADSSARESCSSGDDTEQIVEKLVVPLGKTLEERLKNRGVSDKCPVCKLFNRFQTVNRASTCTLGGEPHCTNHAQHEFCALFRNVERDKCIEEETLSMGIHSTDIGEFKRKTEDEEKELINIENNNGRLDMKEKRGNSHIINVVNSSQHKTSTGKLEIVGIDSFAQNSLNKSEMESENVNNVNRKTVHHKKLLKRSSTYDLFVGNVCDARNKTVMNHKDDMESNVKRFRGNCQHKVFKHIKALSLEHDYSHYRRYQTENKSHEGTLNSFEWNKANDLDDNSKELYYMEEEDGNIQMSKRKSHYESKQENNIPLGVRDFNNYVNFEAVSRGHVENLAKERQKIENAQSFHGCFRNEHSRYNKRSNSNCFEDKNDLEKEKAVFKAIPNDKHHYHYKSLNTLEESVRKPPEMNLSQIKTYESIKTTRNETRQDISKSREYHFDQILGTLMSSKHIFHPNCSYQRKISQTYQSKYDSEWGQDHFQTKYIKNDDGHDDFNENKTDKAEVCNRYICKHKEEEKNNTNLAYHPQLCFEVSNKNRRILRRKSFDLNTYNSKESLTHQRFSYDHKEKQLVGKISRRKSCDFGQITRIQKERSKRDTREQRTNIRHEEEFNNNFKKRLIERSWSNESIADMCSIFENPMTSHFLTEDTDELLQQLKEKGLETIKKKWTDTNIKTEFKDHSERRKKAMFTRRSSVSIMHNLQPHLTKTVDEHEINASNYQTSLVPEDERSFDVQTKLRYSRSFYSQAKDIGMYGKNNKIEREIPKPNESTEILHTDERPHSGKYVLKKRKSLNF